ncbi:MAG TPA: hypothetical protein VG347_16380 [Verrucomicrobiae bacterium]|nr:hypothetical protein [Verrucomicrobiae bacterium]
MKSDQSLNGSDQLMRGFDFESRRGGFAGNQCQIILELPAKISLSTLTARVNALQKEFPITHARLGGVFKPRWKIRDDPKRTVVIESHEDAPGLREELLNTPLDLKRGRLMRFDLIERVDGQMDVIFTWAHTLMDATAAEHFLTAVSDEKIVLPKTNPQPPGAPAKWPERLELMKKSVAQLDKFCEQQPRALKTRRPEAPRELRYLVERFSAEETKTVRANGSRLCGILGDAQFHAIAAVLELHALHQHLGAVTKSYIIPMPVGLRPKGRVEPLFSNQVDMLMLQFLPEQLESVEKAVAALKAQTSQALRENSISYGRKLSELFSFLPLPVYMAVLKHGLKGEVCSLFFGDTAAVNPKSENFLGVPVNNFTHLAAVTPSPGLGVIYYYFRGELRVSIVYARTVLKDNEAIDFAATLRYRLLNS